MESCDASCMTRMSEILPAVLNERMPGVRAFVVVLICARIHDQD
jgi:hypothetical protein